MAAASGGHACGHKLGCQLYLTTAGLKLWSETSYGEMLVTPAASKDSSSKVMRKDTYCDVFTLLRGAHRSDRISSITGTLQMMKAEFKARVTAGSVAILSVATWLLLGTGC